MVGVRHDLICICLLLFTLSIQQSVQVKKPKSSVVTNIEDMKEFKKLLRTKTNVLILYINSPKASVAVSEVVKNVADNMKGQATLVSIDCNTDAKKICKKLKIPSDKPYYLKHYKDGEFYKDYDRGETLSAMTNFLRDPTGDLPWEEDPKAADIFHLSDGEALNRFLKRGAVTNKRAMIMFYAPWCGYCKTLKPEYVQAAADLKGEALLAAIDVAKPGNSKVRQQYNITGFPTLMFYEKGQFRVPYNGENKRQAIVDFIRDPATYAQKKKSDPEEESWSQDSDVVHLTKNVADMISKQPTTKAINRSGAEMKTASLVKSFHQNKLDQPGSKNSRPLLPLTRQLGAGRKSAAQQRRSYEAPPQQPALPQLMLPPAQPQCSRGRVSTRQ